VKNRGIAVLLVVIGLSLMLAPEHVPDLVVPDSSGAMRGSVGSVAGSTASGNLA